MKLIFVEFRKPNGDINPCKVLLESISLRDCKFIALTPFAVDQFWKAGFNDFSIPEDFYLWQEDKNYSEWIRGWLEKLEQIIFSRNPSFCVKMDISLTIHCLTMLKNVIDSYVRTAIQYFKIIDEIKPDKIYIFTDDVQEPVDLIDDELYFKYPSVYFRLIGKDFKTEYSDRIFYRDDPVKIMDWFRCLQFIPSWKKNRSLVFAVPMAKKIREAKLKGYKTQILLIPEYESYVIQNEPLIPIPLFQDIDEEFGFPVSTSKRMLWARIRHFFIKIIPELKFYANWYEDYFRMNDFSCLIFNRRNQLYQYGALIAARKVGLKTCYVRHGWDAFADGPDGCWWRSEQRLRPFDYFLCPNQLDLDYYKPLAERYDCEVI